MSAIWFDGPEEEKLAMASKTEREKKYKTQYSTKVKFFFLHIFFYTFFLQFFFYQVLPLSSWTNAEDYHQKYYLRSHNELLSILEFKDDNELRDSYFATKLNAYVDSQGTMNMFNKEIEDWDLSTDIKQKIINYIGKILN